MSSKLKHIPIGARFFHKEYGVTGTIISVIRANNGNHHYATNLDHCEEKIFLFYAENIKEIDVDASNNQRY